MTVGSFTIMATVGAGSSGGCRIDWLLRVVGVRWGGVGLGGFRRGAQGERGRFGAVNVWALVWGLGTGYLRGWLGCGMGFGGSGGVVGGVFRGWGVWFLGGELGSFRGGGVGGATQLLLDVVFWVGVGRFGDVDGGLLAEFSEVRGRGPIRLPFRIERASGRGGEVDPGEGVGLLRGGGASGGGIFVLSSLPGDGEAEVFSDVVEGVFEVGDGVFAGGGVGCWCRWG